MSACAQHPVMLIRILKMPSPDCFGNIQSKFVKAPLQHTICALHWISWTLQMNFSNLSATNSYRAWRVLFSHNGPYSLVLILNSLTLRTTTTKSENRRLNVLPKKHATGNVQSANLETVSDAEGAVDFLASTRAEEATKTVIKDLIPQEIAHFIQQHFGDHSNRVANSHRHGRFTLAKKFDW